MENRISARRPPVDEEEDCKNYRHQGDDAPTGGSPSPTAGGAALVSLPDGRPTRGESPEII
jgi:hypothetical protein